MQVNLHTDVIHTTNSLTECYWMESIAHLPIWIMNTHICICCIDPRWKMDPSVICKLESLIFIFCVNGRYWPSEWFQYSQTFWIWLGSGCGSVGRAVPEVRVLIQSSANFYFGHLIVYSQLYWKDENKEKWGREWAILKNHFGLSKFRYPKLTSSFTDLRVLQIQSVH